MMRGLVFRSILVAAVAVGLGLVTGCFQGPTGPAGKNGTSVTDTVIVKDTTRIIDSSFIRDTVFNLQANCAECHANNQLIVAKQYEWQTTKHDTGTTWMSEGGKASCMACHNGSAFIFTLTSADSANVMANPTNANCRTCHMIHTNYDTTDFRLVGDEKPVKSKNNYSVTFPDMGAGNLCVNCHQLRTAFMADLAAGKGTESINPNNIAGTATMVGTDSVKFSTSAARANDHVGAQAQIISGSGMWLPNGGAAIQSSYHRNVVTDGCVQCHLGPNNVHTYLPEIAACNSSACHAGTEIVGPNGKFDIDSVQTKVIALAKQDRDSLISRGIATWDTTKVWPNPTGFGFSSPAKGKTFPLYVVGAFVNLQDILWDGSKGVHNAKFVEGLLNGSNTDLTK